MRKVLLFFALKYNGDWIKIYKALETKEKISYSELEDIESKINCCYVTIIDQNYPKSLCEIYRPPFVLFYKGDLKSINANCHKLAICDTNKPDEEGIVITNMLVKKLLKRKIVLLINLERGISKTVIENENKGVKVLIIQNIKNYHTLLKNYKPKYIELVISESYDNNLPVKKYEIYRIMSGLMDGVILIQTRLIDQIYQIVNLAYNNNKEVFCLPERITVPNQNNGFIKNGAKLVENIDNIFWKV